ncbi:hypothetical protein [Cellulosilyticum lentocellum]|uniref:hypothetical protein n=1 Tax=Cellulosilyticum lentocellum TaxID=29360 RepID=UPI0005A014E0|nr:hypothetical protein [Cellulosilyticum lentocellum]
MLKSTLNQKRNGEIYMRETVKITNYKQASYYIKEGIKPIDVFYTDKIVFVFNTESTQKVWSLWRDRKTDFNVVK